MSISLEFQITLLHFNCYSMISIHVIIIVVLQNMAVLLFFRGAILVRKSKGPETHFSIVILPISLALCSSLKTTLHFSYIVQGGLMYCFYIVSVI